jgi:hypothetical protein
LLGGDDFPHTLKAAFGRDRLRAGSLRSPVLAGQPHDAEHQELVRDGGGSRSVTS